MGGRNWISHFWVTTVHHSSIWRMNWWLPSYADIHQVEPPTNAMMSTRMAHAASSRSAQTVVNSIIMHRIEPVRSSSRVRFLYFLIRGTQTEESDYHRSKDPPPLSTGSRILRRQMLSFYDTDNVKIHYAKVGQEKANSIRLVIQFSKTDPTGQGRIVIHRSEERRVGKEC